MNDAVSTSIISRIRMQMRFGLTTLLAIILVVAVMLTAYRLHSTRPTMIMHPPTFDGLTDVVEVPDQPSLDLDADFTIEARIKIPVQQSKASETSCIVGKGKGPFSTDHNYYLGVLNRDNRLHFHIGDGVGGYQHLASDQPLTPGQWIRVAAVRGSDRLALYIDGKLAAVAPREIEQAVNDQPLRIGATETLILDHTLGGEIDEVRIWNVARSAEQIEQSFQQSILLLTTNLVFVSKGSTAADPQSLADQAADRLRLSGARVKCDQAGQVHTVDFSGCSIADDDLQLLTDLKPLRLSLRNTSITDAGLTHIRTQTQLEFLNLKATRVTDAGLKKLGGLTALRTLSIERTGITDVGMEHLKQLHKLETLYLGESEVRGPGLEHLRELPVSYLSFQRSEVDDQVAKYIAVLQDLKTLGLDETNVTDDCLPPLSKLMQLAVLWLDHTNVSDVGIADLLRFEKLTSLHVKETNISADALRKLKEGIKSVDH